jgi:antitoxin HicB
MSEIAKYPKTVSYSEEDGGYIAIAPDLPGCSAFGVSEVEALSELSRAMMAWIEAMKAAGNAIPSPSVPVDAEFSGRLLLRLPKSLHGRLAQRAALEGVSLNQFIVTLLSGAYVSHEFECHWKDFGMSALAAQEATPRIAGGRR